MKKKIFVRAPILSATGYGEQSRFALRALRSREDLFDVYVQPIPWGKSGWVWQESEERDWMEAQLRKVVAVYFPVAHFGQLIRNGLFRRAKHSIDGHCPNFIHNRVPAHCGIIALEEKFYCVCSHIAFPLVFVAGAVTSTGHGLGES